MPDRSHLRVCRDLAEPPDLLEPLAKREQEETVVRLVPPVALVRLAVLDPQDSQERRDLLAPTENV